MAPTTLLLVPLLAATPPVPRPRFADVTREAGVSFRHTFGDDEMSSILEATGSGCAFLDYNGDGWPDIYAVSGSYIEGISDPDADEADGPPRRNRLFKSNGDGTFRDVTDEAKVGDAGYGMAVVVGDYDNDGDPDLYVTNYGKNVLYENLGNGTFADATDRAGVGCPLWSVGATFLDYDRDGDLDLFVGNYLEFDPEYRLYYAADDFPGPLAYPGQPDVLYRNNGDKTFTDVAKAAGVANEGRAMGLIATDFDGDGWTDIYVANDAMENYLYRNRGDGTFVDTALDAGTAFSANGDASSSMGGDFGDFDLDGDLDLLVPDLQFNNLYMYAGGGLFEDVTAAVGIAEVSGQYASWGGDLFDFDCDGDLDIFLSNGHAHRLNTQESLLLENVPGPDGRRVFRDIGVQCGEYFRRKFVSRGVAIGDSDNDGDLDVFVLNLDQPSVLLRNDGGNRNHWIMVALRGTRSNRDALGARVTVRAGDLVQVEEKKAATGYLSQDDPRLHFGLGARRRVDEITIRWPSGTVQTIRGVAADQVLEIEEPAGAAEKP